MTDDTTTPRTDDLQFDKAVMPAMALTCSVCKGTINTSYFKLGDESFCASCKDFVETKISERKPELARAFALGAGAALLGAAVYFAVMHFLNLEIGIVAAFIGIGVGQAVRKGSENVGGRKFQFLAVALTWFAIGLAYVAAAAMEPGGQLKLGFFGLLVLVIIAPVLAVISGLSGIISALIIGFGLRRAWMANTPLKLDFRGPFLKPRAAPGTSSPAA